MMRIEVLEYIVNEIVRRYGELPPRFIQNLRRNVRRNFKVSVSTQEIEQFIPLYKDIYQSGAREIRPWLASSFTPSLEEGDRLAAEFGSILQTRYPDQPASILRTVAGWVLYYEVYR